MCHACRAGSTTGMHNISYFTCSSCSEMTKKIRYPKQETFIPTYYCASTIEWNILSTARTL